MSRTFRILQKPWFVWGLVIGIVLGFPQPSGAQYTADFQTNIISGVISNTPYVDYLVGNTNFADVLTIQNSGVLYDYIGYLGYTSRSSNNNVLVTGSGSAWLHYFKLYVGSYGGNNSLVISDGGCVGSMVFAPWSYVGDNSSNNSVLVTGTGSVWSNAYLYVGTSGAGNSVVVSNGGRMVGCGGTTTMGSAYHSDNNTVRITGSNSVWTTVGSLVLGDLGGSNSLVITDGGQVTIGTDAFVGKKGNPTDYNSMLVSGPGSICNSTNLYIGYGGRGNSLVITNGAQVIDRTGYAGYGGDGGSVRVVDGGVWRNDRLFVGYLGTRASLVVDGGLVSAGSLTIGYFGAGCESFVQVNSGNLIVTNATHDATLEIRKGRFVLNGGVIQVDKLLIEDLCTPFVWNGGTLIVGTLVLSPNDDADGDGMPNGWEQKYGFDPLRAAKASTDSDGDGMSDLQEYLAGTDPTNSASVFRITSAVATGNDLLITWQMGSGKTNALQATSGNYNTNNLVDIFIVTNTVGVTTNYLDAGAATNIPTRFYRVRLVP